MHSGFILTIPSNIRRRGGGGTVLRTLMLAEREFVSNWGFPEICTPVGPSHDVTEYANEGKYDFDSPS